MRVLITDDAAFMRMMLRDILTKNGHEVCAEASDGYELLLRYEETSPDLVMLDITMPNMDGLQALKELRKKHPNANVVMCSAMGQQAMVVEAIQNGAKDFIVKPFKADRVVECLSKFGG